MYIILICIVIMNFILLLVRIYDNKEELFFIENLEIKFIKEVEKLDLL